MKCLRAKLSQSRFQMGFSYKPWLLLLLTLSTLAYSQHVTAASATDANDLKKLSQQIIDLRAEIEALQDTLEAQKETYRSRMQSLNLKKADLTATVQREEIAIKQLRTGIENIKGELAKKLSADQDITAIVQQSIDILRSYIQTSMPFKQQERLTNLNDMETKLEDGSVSPYRLANQLWASVEDEIRLHRDVGIYKQVLTIDGKEQLSDVVKLGMLTMYARTPDKSYAQLKKQEDSWQLLAVGDIESQQAIDQLFDAVKKQIRIGAFDLPNLL